MTATAGFAANTTGAIIAVVAGGTNVSLPSAQILPADITVDVTNTTFTVLTSGRYRLSYHVNTQAAVAAGTRLLLNGGAILASTITPVASLTGFSNEVIVNLTANDTLNLQLFGIVAAVALLGGSAGASLMIVRLS